MDTKKYLELPVEIDGELKNLIKRAYLNAIDSMEEDEFNYIDAKIQNKVEETKSIKPEWVSNLTLLYQRFYEILKQARNNELRISKKAYKAIGAALFYFINPYDIIPDFTPEIGYADDFYVLILCLESVDEKDKKVVLSQLKMKQRKQ